jgi:hypothetical protein
MCMIEALHNFTCETGTCDISHVKFHIMCFIIVFIMCFTCKVSFTCEIMCFTCEVSHVKFHMWIWNMWIWNMWLFTCEIMCFTCETSHVKFHMWIWNMWIWNMWNIISHVKFHMWNFTCEKSHVPNSHVQFHTCEIMWNFCKGIIIFQINGKALYCRFERVNI